MPSSHPPPVLLWFRNDLRLSDQAALQAALATGQPVLPVHILDDASAGTWAPGAASRWWLHHSLAALAADLAGRGSTLVLRRGDAGEELPRLVAETGATEVFTGGSVEPWARRLDTRVAERIAPVPLRRMRTTMLFHPEAVRSRTGGAFSVYSPFAKACLAAAPPKPPVPAPARIPCPDPPRSDRLEDWGLLPTPDWAGGLRDTWTPGEQGAWQRLRDFLDDPLDRYAAARDRPEVEATSRLSPHLHFGEVSAGQVWHAVSSREPGRGRDKFQRELLWREFSIHLLWHHPDLPDEPLRSAFAAMPWRDDPAALRAWQRGRTGIPIVDAGMRQLWQTGWMHNRVRMITASLLTKHLLIPWQDGERWFWDTLVDADLANNAASWQWVAGCGADAAPWFRIFNPVLQGQKFDPDGDYVRRFVPELARLDIRHLHAPWAAPPEALRHAGICLGESYPAPIVDLAQGRARALAAFQALRAEE
ncbi:MAG: deoxyribodipyrimidine photo-lyase [Acetobacteraceae bacterium]